MPLPSDLAVTPIGTTESATGGASLSQGVANRPLNEIQTYVNAKDNFPPVIKLTNKSGVTVADGDLVVLDSANDTAFVRTTTQGDLRPAFVVRSATIADGALGYVQAVSRTVLAVQAAVTRGNYLRASATAGKAEDAGANLVDGVIGKAATSFAGPGAGTVEAILFGSTLRAPSAISSGLHGECQLVKSGSNLLLQRANGSNLIINGTTQTIPSGGVTLAATGLTANTTYLICAYMNAGNMTLEALDSGTYTHGIDTNGVEVKKTIAGGALDATGTLVGMARVITGPAWADSLTQRFVISWFQRRALPGLALSGADAVTSSASYVELRTDLRIEFLTWADEAVHVWGASSAQNTSASQMNLGLQFDATTGQTGRSATWTPSAGGSPGLQDQHVDHPALLTEGYHYVTLVGSVSAGTGTYLASSRSGTGAIIRG